MLEVKNIIKKFGKVTVLKGISFKIEKGDIIGIIGPSGCGKSTFLRALNLLEIPTSGEIIFNNENIIHNKNHSVIRRKIGMVFQQFNLFEQMSVLDNIILAPVKLKIYTKEEAILKARKLLKEIDMAEYENFYPKELSGGQQQRVAIIRTLIMNPEVILFDEPTSALDPEMIGEVIKLMRSIASKGITMVIVSHEMRFIKNFVTKVVFMDEGKFIEVGKPEEIFNNPKDLRLKQFLKDVDNV